MAPPEPHAIVENLAEVPTAAQRTGAWLGSTACTAVGGCCLSALLAAAPTALIVAGVALIAGAFGVGLSAGGVGGLCCIALGLFYGILIIIPGALTFGPLSGAGAAGGSCALSLISRPVWARILIGTSLIDWRGRLRDALVAGAVLSAALPGILVGISATIAMLGGAVWFSRNNENPRLDGNGIGPGSVTMFLGVLAAPLAGFLAVGGATLAAIAVGALMDLILAPRLQAADDGN